MPSLPTLSMAELNGIALDHFVYQPVTQSMVSYLAQAATSVIQCDPTMMPSAQQNKSQLPTPPRTPSPRVISCDDGGMPSLEDFISQLILSSNVQVPTLMSTLVYMTRLKSRLQPMAKGLRCTTHRIFLAALILAAKYLNDSSPKNKHWANYSHISIEDYSFGFSRVEVNLMERQLLFLLDWNLRITEEDLHRELDPFLAPIRTEVEAKYARRMTRKRELAQRKREEAEAWAAARRLPSPPVSRSNSRTGPVVEETIRLVHDPSSPPELSYSSSTSSSSSYASSVCSRQHSRASTPQSDLEEPYVYTRGDLHESPVEVVLEMPQPTASRGKKLLPYEISADQLRELQDGHNKAKRPRTGRGVWNRMFGGVTTR